MWVVGALRDVDVARLAPQFDRVVLGCKNDPAEQERWRRWVEAPELVRGLRPMPRPDYPNWMGLDAASDSFGKLGDYPLTQADPLISDCQNAFVPAVEPFGMVTRKVHPVQVLFHGLGPAKAAILPGWFGDFIVTGEQCRALLPQVEGALAPPPAELPDVLARAQDWLTVGDDPDFAVEPLLGTLLDCWRAAVGNQLGLCGTTDTV